MSDRQLKIDCYIHRVLYMNINVTTNQKPVIYIQKIIKRNPNIILKESHQVRREDSKRETENYKNNQNTINKMATKAHT